MKSKIKKIWHGDDSALYFRREGKKQQKLDNVVYELKVDMYGEFYLSKVSDDFSFTHKIYGMETKFIARTVKTYSAINHNLGVLLNGIKGTGKTVTAKIICNELKQPVVLVNFKGDGVPLFLNSIEQEITIFVDEYEKVFGETTSMLTIMDGALNSEFKRCFILTTNKLYLDSNLLQRPGRIRYLKTFSNLEPDTIESIVDDILVNKKLKDETVNFISQLETITVDIVKAVLAEVNIHDEAPSKFADVFNVVKITGKFNVTILDGDVETIAAKNVDIYPKPNYYANSLNSILRIDDEYFGKITDILNWTTLEIAPYNSKTDLYDTSSPILIKISDASMVNYSYAYYGGSGVGTTKPEINGGIKSILDRNREADESNQEEVLGTDCEIKLQEG